MAAPTEISLFSGAGGGVIASRMLGHRVVCYVEREPFCVDVLKARIADGSIDDAPIWDDVRAFDGRPWRGLVDIVSGGPPCQPHSVAGARAGSDDERNLWPEMLRVIREVRPGFVFVENVPGISFGGDSYLLQILGDLAEAGFDAEWDALSACECGAPHTRDRVFVLAHAQSERRQRRWCPEQDSAPLEPEGRRAEPRWSWPDKSRPVGVAYGLAHRVDRLHAVGNGQVPVVVARAFRRLRTRLSGVSQE